MPAGIAHCLPKEVEPASSSVWDWDRPIQSQNSAVNLASGDGFVESISDVKCLRVSHSRRVSQKMALQPESGIGLPEESIPIRQGKGYELLPVCLGILGEKAWLIRRHVEYFHRVLRGDRCYHAPAHDQVKTDYLSKICVERRGDGIADGILPRFFSLVFFLFRRHGKESVFNASQELERLSDLVYFQISDLLCEVGGELRHGCGDLLRHTADPQISPSTEGCPQLSANPTAQTPLVQQVT